MGEQSTNAAVQRFLDALAGDTAPEPIVRELLERAVRRLQLLSGAVLHRSYPRLTRPPLNLSTDELLGGVVAGLLPAMRTVRPRYRAARAAAVAGCGGGADGAALSELERARWRRRAVAWLRLDLAAWRKRLVGAQEAERAEVRKALARWRGDPDLAGLRDADALARLRPVERQGCQALCQEVAALLRRT